MLPVPKRKAALQRGQPAAHRRSAADVDVIGSVGGLGASWSGGGDGIFGEARMGSSSLTGRTFSGHVAASPWRGSAVRSSMSRMGTGPGTRLASADSIAQCKQNSASAGRGRGSLLEEDPPLPSRASWSGYVVRPSSFARRSSPSDASSLRASHSTVFSIPLPRRDGEPERQREPKLRPKSAAPRATTGGVAFGSSSSSSSSRRRTDLPQQQQQQQQQRNGRTGSKYADRGSELHLEQHVEGSRAEDVTPLSAAAGLPETGGRRHEVKRVDEVDGEEVLVRFRPFSAGDLALKGRTIRQLTLQANALMSIPTSVSRLKHLVGLTVTWNALVSIPPWICELRKLRKLDASFNQILHVPREVAMLTNLEILKLNDNKISRLPPALASMKSLRALHVQFNCLSEVPPPFQKWTRGLGGVSQLDLFDVRGNPCSALKHKDGDHSSVGGAGSKVEGEDERGQCAGPRDVRAGIPASESGEGEDAEDDLHCVVRLMTSYDASLVPLLEEALAQV